MSESQMPIFREHANKGHVFWFAVVIRLAADAIRFLPAYSKTEKKSSGSFPEHLLEVVIIFVRLPTRILFVKTTEDGAHSRITAASVIQDIKE